MFLQQLIDVYILPMLQSNSRDFAPLAAALARLAGIIALGIIMQYAYTRIMVNVGQGTMLKIRKRLFNNMESLPISYFDTHSHRDIMSIYTHDVDTLRQLIGQCRQNA